MYIEELERTDLALRNLTSTDPIWHEVTERLNAIPYGIKRTPQSWRKCLLEWEANVRDKLAEEIEFKLNGKGKEQPPWRNKEMDKRLLAALRLDRVDGINESIDKLKRVERTMKTTDEQFEMYVEQLENNIRNGQAFCNEMWSEMVERLNSVYGPSKTLIDWKKVFTEWKSNTKKRARDKNYQLSSIQHRVLSVLQGKIWEQTVPTIPATTINSDATTAADIKEKYSEVAKPRQYIRIKKYSALNKIILDDDSKLLTRKQLTENIKESKVLNVNKSKVGKTQKSSSLINISYNSDENDSEEIDRYHINDINAYPNKDSVNIEENVDNEHISIKSHEHSINNIENINEEIMIDEERTSYIVAPLKIKNENENIVKNFKKCRGCLSCETVENSNFFPLFSTSELTNSFDKLNHMGKTFSQCIRLEVNINDLLPKWICQNCWNICENWNSFRVSCLQTYKIYTDMVNYESDDDNNDKLLIKKQLYAAEEDNDHENEVDKREIKEDDDNDEVISIIYVNENYDGHILNELFDATPTATNENDKLTSPKKSKRKRQQRISVFNVTREPTSFECVICHDIFADIPNLLYHKKMHNERNPFLCDQCGKSFTTLGGLKIHIDTVHQLQRHFECIHCKRRYKSMRTLNNHIFVLHNPTHSRYMCKMCNKKYPSNSGLKLHMKKHKPTERPYRCPLCKQAFATVASMNGHLQNPMSHI